MGNRQMAVMALNHVIDNRQTKATVALLTTGWVQPLKRLQCLGPLLHRHAAALVPNFKVHVLLLLPEAHNHRCTAVTEGVVDQIHDGTSEGHRANVGRQRRKVEVQSIGGI